jgi:2-polyprenyl-3-methyl-5-hydroxy-6-metoxy-1,4-benzoquinol methylase
LTDLEGEQPFDTILYIDVLEHIEDDRGELLSALRVLEPGGRLIIVAPAHQCLYTEFDRRIGHCRRYAKAELLSALPAEFRVQKMRYLDSAGLLASVANRTLLKSSSPTPAQIRLWDNWMVRTSRLIDPVFRYRLGKTILCIARREN